MCLLLNSKNDTTNLYFIHPKYLNELRALGFSELSAVTAETLFTAVQKMKFYLMIGTQTIDDPLHQLIRPDLPPHDHLREALYTSGHLHEIFNTPKLMQAM